jgi:3-deoxy-7-phosphoheptulonate synthase
MTALLVDRLTPRSVRVGAFKPRTSCSAGRNTLDLSAVLRLRARTGLPIIVAAGIREDVVPLACAAAAVGADGIIVEVHERPDEALCDGPQAILPEEFSSLVSRFQAISSMCRGTTATGKESSRC